MRLKVNQQRNAVRLEISFAEKMQTERLTTASLLLPKSRERVLTFFSGETSPQFTNTSL
jgi:hypothetical protein